MTAETIHTCSYECDRPGCIRAQRDELVARMAAETSNARGEWPERYACNGPEGTFWTDDATLANKLIGAAFDRDEWTVTDTQNPTGATPPPPADVEVRARELLAQHEQLDKTGGAPVVRRDDAIRAIASALSHQPEARVYQCPRCATSMEVDPTAKPEARGGGEVAAWETEDGRVISARQKATALRDGGASASSVAPYTTPLYRTAPPSAPVVVERGLRYAVRVWVLSDEIMWSEEKIDEVVESIIADAKKEKGK